MKEKSFYRILVVITLILSGIVLLTAQEPTWIWANNAGGIGSSTSGSGIALDDEGNSFVTGWFQETVTFGDIELQSRGHSDIFVAKLSNTGEWLWAERAGGTESDESFGIDLDIEGNVYITGYFRETADFGENELQSAGATDIFIAKLSTDGDWLWVMNIGGIVQQRGTAIKLDEDGNCFIGGYFNRSISFGETELQATGLSDVFIAKLNPDREWVWAQRAGSTGTMITTNTGIGFDDERHIYLTGNFQGTATFGETELHSRGGWDCYVAKLNSDGEWLWAVSGGGTDYDNSSSIAVDSLGNSYITGIFRRTSSFGDIELVSIGSDDIFIAKLNSEGEWLWASRAGSTDNDRGYDVVIDSEGNCYVTGSFSRTADFGDYIIESSGSEDIFISAINNEGEWLWALAAGGTGIDRGRGIVIDDFGKCYLTGFFTSSTIQFGEIELENLGSPGYSDVLVAKIGMYYNYPLTAVKPVPVDDTTGVAVDLESLDWKYVENESYANPLGFRVYFGTDPDSLSQHGTFIEYEEGKENYSMNRGHAPHLLYKTTYYWKVVPTTKENGEGEGYDAEDCPVWCFTTEEEETSVEDIVPALITELKQNYPNPFNPETAIEFNIQKDTEANLSIYNIKGQIVKTLHSGLIKAGEHRIIWNGNDEHGREVSSGIYFYRLTTDHYDQVNKMLLVK